MASRFADLYQCSGDFLQSFKHWLPNFKKIFEVCFLDTTYIVISVVHQMCVYCVQSVFLKINSQIEYYHFMGYNLN